MKRTPSLEEVDLGDKFAIVIDFNEPRRHSDPGPSTDINVAQPSGTTTYDPLTNLDDVYNSTPCTNTLSSRAPSICSEPASPITPAPTPTRSNSLDIPLLEVPVSKPTIPTNPIQAVTRTPPNARLIRRNPSPVSEPTSSLRMDRYPFMRNPFMRSAHYTF